MHPFHSADILLPKDTPMDQWAVIACDQFVSQPEYWQRVRKFVGNTPSALHLILPEADLDQDPAAATKTINENMYRYIKEDLFRLYPDCFIYVERTLQNGTVRQGVVGCVDLEQYDFHPESCAPIRSTEKTVPERVPPRMDIRRDAPIELPHVLLLCDDEEQVLIETLSGKKAHMPKLYSFQLMEQGGLIEGWLAAGQDAEDFRKALEHYADRMAEKYGKNSILYAVGDGNHSLAAAKGCYEELKKQGVIDSPARSALVELENIHHSAQVFEPIHRIVKNTDPDALLKALSEEICCPGGAQVIWHIGQRTGSIYIDISSKELPVGVVQNFLDRYLQDHPGIVDYIHGEKDVAELSRQESTLGLIMPPVEKNAFFGGIVSGGELPRKTFSMGHAREKRYYLEARKIK